MDYNQVTICGRLGKDPDMRYTPSGTAVTNFSVAITSYSKKDDGSGYDDHTTWIDVTCWGKTAERVAEYAKKGTEVLVGGRLDTRSWEDKEDATKKHFRTFVTGLNVQMGQGRKTADEASQGEAPAGESQEAPPAAPDAPAAPPATAAASAAEEDDDLPF